MGLRAPQAPQVAQVAKTPLPEFQAQRKKVEQRINADTQGQQDAMSRRFAAQGMLNSGAAIKNQGLVANQAAQNREDALAQVDAAEIGEQQRRQEVVDSRDFAANESRLGRDFAAGESKLGRDFQGSESAIARALQASQFDRSFDHSGKQFDRTFEQSGKQFDKQFGLQKDQFAAERSDQGHNIDVSLAQMKDDQRRKYDIANARRTGKPIPVDPRVQAAQQQMEQGGPFGRREGGMYTKNGYR